MKELHYGVKDLQAHLSQALRAAEAGNRVVVTRNNREILEISIPRRTARKVSAADRALERLIQRGVLSPARKTGPIPAFKPLRIGGLLEQLLADRR